MLSTLTIFSQKRKQEVIIPQTQKDSLTLEAVLVEAEKQLILENYSKALESFQVALGMNSESAAINFKIAEVLTKSNEGKNSLPYGLRSIKLDPENKYYRLALARVYTSVGFYIDAAKTYEALLGKFPADESALYELAELYQLSGRKDDMFKTFDKIETQLGVKEEIVRERQRILMKEGKVNLVIDEYRKLIDAYPNENSFRVEFISFLIQNNNLEEAEKEIISYENSESSSARVTLLKSELSWMKGERETALRLLAEALKTKTIDFETKFQIVSNYLTMTSKPDDREKLTVISQSLAEQYQDQFKAQAFVGDLLYQSGRKEEATSYYLKSLKLSPSNYSVWQNTINIEAELNQYDSVVAHSERALEYFPNQAVLYYFAGTGYMILKDYKKATRVLELGKKYTVDPSLLTVFYGQLGDAYNSLKEKEKSYQAYENALKNKPDNDHVLNNYSFFLSLDKQRLDRALAMSTKLIEMHPDNPTYLDTHGWVLYVSGQFKESKKYLEKAVSLDEDGTVIEHYGDVLFKLGNVSEAILQWERARDLGEASELIEKKIEDRKLYE
ncbi:MAG: tetratricopeptide repeat protein [Ekhidna sp.]